MLWDALSLSPSTNANLCPANHHPIATFHVSTVHTPLTNPALPLPPFFFFFKLPHTLEKHTHPSQIPPLEHFTMATTTPSFTPFFTHTQLLFSFLATLLLLLLTSPTPSRSFKVSGISAAPALLPTEPKISSIPPTLAPDMMPFFPSPGGNAGAAPGGTLPTIPSSPSPPNPDEWQPNSAVTPHGPAAAMSAASPTSLGKLGGVSMALFCGLVLMWWLELVDY